MVKRIGDLLAFVGCFVVHLVLIWPLAIAERLIDRKRRERRREYL